MYITNSVVELLLAGLSVRNENQSLDAVVPFFVFFFKFLL